MASHGLNLVITHSASYRTESSILVVDHIRGPKTRQKYVAASIDTKTMLYTTAGTNPGTVKNIVSGPGITGLQKRLILRSTPASLPALLATTMDAVDRASEKAAVRHPLPCSILMPILRDLHLYLGSFQAI